MSLRWERLAASGKTLGVAAGSCCRTDRTGRGIGVLTPSARRKEIQNESCGHTGLGCYSCGGESAGWDAASPGAGPVPYRRGSRSRRGCSGRRMSALHRPIGFPIRCQRKCCLSWEAASWSHVGRQAHVVTSLLFTSFSQSRVRHHFPTRISPNTSICLNVALVRTFAENGGTGDGDVIENLSASEVHVSNHLGNGALQETFHEDVVTEQAIGDDLSPEFKRPPEAFDKLSVTLIAFDIETTGLSRLDRIVEFACRDLAGGEISTLQTLVNPGKKVGASEFVHRITDEMVNNPNVPKWQQVAPVIIQFVEGRRRRSGHVVLIAHNARTFDVPMMINHFNDSGVQLPSHWLFLDSLPLARDALVAKGVFTKKCSLQFMRDHYNLPHPPQTHRAMDDVDVLVAVLQNILSDLRLTPTDLLDRAFFASDCKPSAEKAVRHLDAGVQGLPSVQLVEISAEIGDGKVTNVNIAADVVECNEALSTENSAECAVHDSSSCTATHQIQGHDFDMTLQISTEYKFKGQEEGSELNAGPFKDQAMLAEDCPVQLVDHTTAAFENHGRTQIEIRSTQSDPLAPLDPSDVEKLSCNQAVGSEITTRELPALHPAEPESKEMELERYHSNVVIWGDTETTEVQTGLQSSMVDTALLTPMLKQYVEIKQQRPYFLLLSRIGDFFEAFFEDAQKLSEACGVRLAVVDGGKMLGKKVPMAGVPLHRIDVYLKMLLNKGISVVKLDQVASDADCKQGNLLRREVTGVWTPGTILDSSMLEDRENNYLVAILPPSNEAGVWGLAYSDVSTGEFIVTHSHGRMALVQEILRLRPAEIIYPANVPCVPHEGSTCRHPLGMPMQLCYVERAAADFFPSLAKKKLLSCFGVHSLESLGIQDLSFGLRAAGGLLSYLQEIQKVSSKSIPLCVPRSYTIDSFMKVDETARRHLELLKASRNGGTKGSLLWAIDHTKTAMGARLLRRWLLLPLVVHGDICSRHDAVETLASSHELRVQLRHKLSMIADLERLAGRVAWRRSDARDLVFLANSLHVLPSLFCLLRRLPENIYFKSMEHSLPELSSLAIRIQATLRDEPSGNPSKGSGVVRSGADKELDRLQNDVESIDLLISSYEKQEQERTDIPSLEVGYARPAGSFISIRKSRSKEDVIPKEYERIQSSRHEDRYITSALLDYDRRRLLAVSKVAEREEKLVLELREEAGKILEPLRSISHGLAAIDVLANFADLAVERNYCRPTVLEQGREITIVNGRHAIVEALLPRGVSFVPNSTYMGFTSGRSQTGFEGAANLGGVVGSFTVEGGVTNCQLNANTEIDSEKPEFLSTEDVGPRADLIIVTGPNASGKSCYLRQIGLIQLLAQAGSFVPAECSRLSIADGLYTRVGTIDDLTTEESSFKVEMQETAQILTAATSRSLVLLDEVGRGTGAQEGEALARAIIEYLSQRVHARTVASTYYHNLHALDREYPNIANFCFDVTHDEHGAVVLDHALKPGHCLYSYGIAVGRLSGIPEWICSRAEEHLSIGGSHKLETVQTASSSELMDREQTLEETALLQDDLSTGSCTRFGLRQLDRDNLQIDLSDLLSGTSINCPGLDEGAPPAASESEDIQIAIQRSSQEWFGSTSDELLGSNDSVVVSQTPEAAAGSQHPEDSIDCAFPKTVAPKGTSSAHMGLVEPWRAGRYGSVGLRGSEAPKWNIWFWRRNQKENSSGLSVQLPNENTSTASVAGSSQEEPTDEEDPVTSSSTVMPCQDTRMPQEELDNVWTRACELLCTEPATQALAIQKGSLISISSTGEALRVCLGSSALFVKKFQQRKHAEPVQTALEAVLGQPVQINFSLVREHEKP